LDSRDVRPTTEEELRPKPPDNERETAMMFIKPAAQPPSGASVHLPLARPRRRRPETGKGPEPTRVLQAWGTNQVFQWKKKKGPSASRSTTASSATPGASDDQDPKAFADQPGVKGNLKEFKVISTGEDLPAQIAAATLHRRRLRRGHRQCAQPGGFRAGGKGQAAGRSLSFDNGSVDATSSSSGQVDLGRLAANAAQGDQADGGKLRGPRPSGNSVDRIGTTDFTKP